MSPTKVKELTPVTKAKADDARCRICHPKPDRLYEDDLWGQCVTNAPHSLSRDLQTREKKSDG